MTQVMEKTLADHLASLESEIAEIFEDDHLPKREVIQPTVVVAEQPVIPQNPEQWNPCVYVSLT